MTRVLLADDNYMFLEGFGIWLEREFGYAVTAVASLGEAIAEARSTPFDYLITDKNIGGHRGIVPLLDVMQQERPHVPVILCSAEDGEQAVKELYCHEFVRKGPARQMEGHFRETFRKYAENPI